MIMATKTVPFNKSGIATLPNDKPVVYTIETDSGKKNYIGSAKRGRVQDRLQEHLPKARDTIPGTKVRIQQVPTIQDAKRKEETVIHRS